MKKLLIIILLLFSWNLLEAQDSTVTFAYNHDVVDSNWIDILARETAKGDLWFNTFMDGMISRGEAKENAGFWYLALIDEEFFTAPVLLLNTDQDYNLQQRPNGWAPFEIVGDDTVALVADSIVYRQITIDKSDFAISLAIDERGSMKIRKPSDALMRTIFPEKVYRTKTKKMKDLRSHMKKMEERKR